MTHRSQPSRNPNSRVNTLGIGSAGLAKILDVLDRSSASTIAARREFVRWPFRREAVEVAFDTPTGGANTLLLACRNLSSGGIGVLHNAFVHSGTRCMVAIPRIHGGAATVSGTVVRCVHRTGMLHEVAIQFSSPVNIREFVPVGMHFEAVAVERVDPARLRGVLLHFSASAGDRAAVREMLRSTSIIVRSVCDEESLAEQLRLGCDMALLDLPRTQLRALVDRFHSPSGPLFLGVASHAPEARLIQLTCPGVATVVLRPFTRGGLVRMAADMLQLRTVRSASEDRSNLPTHQFLTLTQQLLAAAASAEADRCKQLCMTASRVAGDLGYAELGSLAERTCSALAKFARPSPKRLILLVRPLAHQLSEITGSAA